MRRIVVACDGTGQSASREIKPTTNVIRFCHALSTDFNSTPTNPTPAQQILFYQSGVGTAAGGLVHDAVAEGTGLGIDDNILDAYTFIMNNYIQDDELYIFGFSRGAFTARVLASLIIKLGVFRTKYLSDFKEAFKAYRTSPQAWEEHLKKLQTDVEHDLATKFVARTQKAIIKVVGCWDTVGSVGLPVVQPIFGFFSGSSGVYDPSLLGDSSSSTLFARIDNAFHALALDEYRRPFSPTLWYLPDNCGANIEQCWFPGVHSNVGGGYADSALADIALAWMIERCTPFLSFDPKELDYISDLHRNPKPTSRPENEGKYDKVYKGWAKGRLYDSYRESLYTVQAQGWRYRRPGEYGAKEGADGHSVATEEVMHASVRVRWNARQELRWKPESLSGFEPRQKATGGWEWFRPGKWGKPDLVIAEAPIEPNSFEAVLRDGT
ncbi:hypothetical protein BDZ94DRAFT_1159583 [Collybia nuda]|uniref:T6SS Phospholipase effector Tle1-like catalytic domain-containing protein n=1 Tax=Collybia nuda TaxID=64659 RepID=A0A9P5YBN9_9AGAR|nr:hypothetical protein BDZ94DRAFT_1159583 [Collybia nuda]